MTAEEYTPETAIVYLAMPKPVGAAKRERRYFGMACLKASGVSDRELHVNRFGLQFSKDSSWQEPLLGHLSRKPLFIARLSAANSHGKSAAQLTFHVLTSPHGNLGDALNEAVKRKHDIKTEVTMTFGLATEEVRDHACDSVGFYWDHERNIGVARKRDGKFVGVACFALKGANNTGSRGMFGFKGARLHWRGISSLLGQLSRGPRFEALLVTSDNVPFELEPDIPEQVQGRSDWVEHNYNYHKGKVDSLARQVEGHMQAPGFWNAPPPQLLEQLEAEERNANRFLQELRELESVKREHSRPFHQMKEKLFTACMLIYVQTPDCQTLEEAYRGILAMKSTAESEIGSYYISRTDVADPDVAFGRFVIDEEFLANYGETAMCGAAGGYDADIEVAFALRKMMMLAVSLPREGVAVEEKILLPEGLPSETPRSAYLGHVASSLMRRSHSKEKVFFPLDILTKHGIITGSSGQGKTYFAMHLALQAAARGIECLIIDPHRHFKLLPQRERIKIQYVSHHDTERIVAILNEVYDEALRQPIQAGEPKLRKLIIIDEISSFNFKVRAILPILNSCFSELRKFGYGLVIICTYATEDRAISPAVRENSETYFVFRKKTLNELERVKTMKHPNMGIIPYLTTGFFMLYSEAYYPDPFFVEVPRIDSLLSKEEIPPISPGTSGTSIPNEHKGFDTAGADAGATPPHPPQKAVCMRCGYSWLPRMPLDEIKRCPKCYSRQWRGRPA